MANASDHHAIEVKIEVRSLVRISGTYYLSIPPEFIRAHNLEAGEGLLVKIGNVLTIAPIPRGEVIIPKEEILLPYPENIDASDEGRLSVAAFARNYQRINEYAKKERPDWELLEVKMKTVIRDGKRLFLVTEITNASKTRDEQGGTNEQSNRDSD